MAQEEERGVGRALGERVVERGRDVFQGRREGAPRGQGTPAGLAEARRPDPGDAIEDGGLEAHGVVDGATLDRERIRAPGLDGPVRGNGQIIRELNTGLHLKTAGTTWLEELIGLAEGGGEGLAIAKEIYRTAYGMLDELTAPYADVIDIDPAALPSPDEVDAWTGKQFADALRHDQSNPAYNLNLRQLLHVSFKLAAKMGQRYLDALDEHREHVERNVTENLYERHLKPLFEA